MIGNIVADIAVILKTLPTKEIVQNLAEKVFVTSLVLFALFCMVNLTDLWDSINNRAKSYCNYRYAVY